MFQTIIRQALLLVLACLGVLATCAHGFAQTAQAGNDEQRASIMEKIELAILPEDFSRLNARKKRLETEVADLTKERDVQSAFLENSKGKQRFIEDRVARDKSNLKNLELTIVRLNQPRSSIDLRERLDGLRSELETTQARVTRTDIELAQTKVEIGVAEKALKDAAEKLADRRAQLLSVERSIDHNLNVEASRLKWRTVIALMFCIVLVVLIWWFFKIAQADEVVRRAVFSAQAGIQFLTLFCLVISIVLFGVAGILEGKELSALLGGLSGYILGRVTTAPSKND